MSTSPKAAPGDLELVRAFVNSVDREEGREALVSPQALATWLAEHGLADDVAAPDGRDLHRAIALREALRELLIVNNDGRAVDSAASAVLDDVAGRASLRLRVAGDGSVRLEVAEAGVDGALGRLMVVVYRAMEDGTWARLKACRNDTCRWAFYDRSRNSSGHWCTMSVCGNRRKAREYRRRQRTAANA